MSLVRFEKVWRLIGANGLVLASGSWDDVLAALRAEQA
jgi:hypothetical protein